MRAIIRFGALLSASLLVVASGGVDAQVTTPAPDASGRLFSIVPSLSISETLTDNSGLSSSNRQADLITQVSPGIHISSSGGRIKGFLDYSLTGVDYARTSSGNELQNSLNALASIEAVENWAFMDASANISQQVTSAFGTRSANSSLINGNRTEVRTLLLSPYVKGRLAGFADYEARVSQTWSNNSTSEAANNRTTQATLHVAGVTGLQVLSWSADASHLAYDYTVGPRTVDDTVSGIVYITVDPQLRVSLIEGDESNNILSAQRESHSTPGFGFDWSPTERTKISAQLERRFFGSSHLFSFEHRTPRTVWSYTDSQNISTGFGQPVFGSLGTAYDLYFAQFASLQPDPALRATLVNDFLAANGIAPTTQLFAGSLAAAVTKQHLQQLSFALLGIRDTVTFAASQSEARRLNSAVVVVDDFANGNLVRERGISISVAHRLTPSSSVSLVASIDRISGTVGSPSTDLRSVNLYWTGQLSSRSTLLVGVRHSEFSSPSDPYTENAVTATLGLRF